MTNPSSIPFKSRRRAVSLVANSRWSKYATAGAASGLALAATADADIHHVDVNAPFNAAPGATVQKTYYFGALSALFVIEQRQHNPGPNGHAEFIIQGAVSAKFAGSIGATTNFRYPFRLASGANIAAQPFVSNFQSNGFIYFATLASHAAGGNFLAAGTGFIGFKFDAGAGTQYGWIRLNMNGSPTNGFTLVDYAYADVGTSITAGQTAVPEPGSLALLAFGGVGLLAWRKQRAKAAAQA